MIFRVEKCFAKHLLITIAEYFSPLSRRALTEEGCEEKWLMQSQARGEK